MLSLLRAQLRTQDGAVVVIVALALTCLMGFAALTIDLGLLSLNKTRVQTAADAAALAGAPDLLVNSAQAVATAGNYAAANGLPNDRTTSLVGQNNSSLTVTVVRNVNLFFAPLLGVNNSSVSATATATISTAGGVTGVIPVGIEKAAFVYGQTYTLKKGGGSGYCGNYGGLALGGDGGDNYRDNLKYGYSGLLKAGDEIPIATEPGNKVGPTDQGVSYRINLDPEATFSTVQSSSPRIVIVPVIESFAVNGRNTVIIDGFAAFFLEGCSGGIITGKFRQMFSNNFLPGTGPNYGLYNIKLTQ